MLRIFMTGDNHIGLKYAGHEAAARLRAARIDAFKDMTEKANANDCGLFVITGDLFESARNTAKKDIKTVFDTLSLFDGTVAILPGNHDYYSPDSVLWHEIEEAAERRDNIVLLTQNRCYPLTVKDEKVILYPAVCQSPHGEQGKNNLGWIKNENIVPDAAFRIGVAHGAVEGETIDSEGQYFLMSRGELLDIPVDMWLIGHTHVPFPKDLKEDRYSVGEHIFNAGTHVQTDVACNTDGYCFIIEAENAGAGKIVRAKKIKTGNISFRRREIVLRAGEAENIINRELSSLSDNSSVDLILSGAVFDEEYENRNDIVRRALERFIEGTYNDYGMSRLITKELIEKEFPETSFSAKFLSALLDDSKEAQLAYELIKSVEENG